MSTSKPVAISLPSVSFLVRLLLELFCSRGKDTEFRGELAIVWKYPVFCLTRFRLFFSKYPPQYQNGHFQS